MLTTFTKKENRLWTFALFLLAIDVATTWFVVNQIGIVAEGNPVMATVISGYGVWGLVESKIAVFAFGLTLREAVDSHRWVVPFAIICVNLPVAILNTVAVGVTL